MAQTIHHNGVACAMTVRFEALISWSVFCIFYVRDASPALLAMFITGEHHVLRKDEAGISGFTE